MTTNRESTAIITERTSNKTNQKVYIFSFRNRQSKAQNLRKATSATPQYPMLLSHK